MAIKRPTLEDLQTIASSCRVHLPKPGDSHMRSDVSPGQIRPAFFLDAKGRWQKRYVLITHQSDHDTAVVGAMLIHTHPILATQDDVKIRPDDLGYPLEGAVQTSNQAPLLVAQLGAAIAQLDGILLDLILGLNRGGRRDGARTGRLVLDEDDLRAQFANEEWQVMQLMAEDAFEYLGLDEDPLQVLSSQEASLIEIEALSVELNLSHSSDDDELEFRLSLRTHYEGVVAA